ncbi:hypothetical protein B5P44_11555 [Mycobacterium sp. CBMA 213]|nr:hypothetical protein [Mycolicibacterium sp. CBMA 213]
MGLSSDLSFAGLNGSVTITVPVPDGLSLASLNVTAELPIYLRGADLTVTQDKQFIARVPIPAQRGQLIIPLANAKVVEKSVTLRLRADLLPADRYCIDPNLPLRLTDASATYAGGERAPAVVADFLPAVLRKLVIYVNAKPSQAEANAAIQLAEAVAAHYGSQNPVIELAPLVGPDARPAGAGAPMERHIVVTEGTDAGLSLYGSGGIPGMRITARSDQLVNQVRLLTSSLANYAVAPRVVAGQLKSDARPIGNEATLADLGQQDLTDEGINPQVDVPIDQTRIGRPVHHVQVHLRGTYTPLPAGLGGEIVVSAGGKTVARWAAEPSGSIDRMIDVPDRLLKRYTTLTVAVNEAGNTGDCGAYQPMTLTIDSATSVRSEPSSGSVPGFQSVVQSLLPKVQIGVGSDVFGDTARALQVMIGLQRLSSVPIDTAVVGLRDAAASRDPAVLIAPGGLDDANVSLPVSTSGSGPMTLNVVDKSGAPATLTLDPGVRIGSLQVVSNGSKPMLVATSNGAPGQLDKLIGWLSADPWQWSALDGMAVLAIDDREPFVVAVPDTVTSAPGGAGSSVPVALWWIGGVVLAAVIGVGAWRLIRHRGSRA